MKIIVLFLIYLLSIPSDAVRHFQEADSLYNAGKLNEALKAATIAADEAAAARDTTCLIKALCIQINGLIDKGDDMEAVDLYNRCADLYPFSEPMFLLSSSLFNIATIYFQSGAFDEAEEYIIKSLNIDSRRRWDSILALRYMLAANVMYEKGEYEKAMGFAALGRSCAANRRNTNIEARLMLVQAKCKEALSGSDVDWPAMEAEYLDVLEMLFSMNPVYYQGPVNPYAPEIYYLLGHAVAAQGKDAGEYYRKAIESAQVSQEMRGANPLIELECCKALADILLKEGDEEGAAKYLERADVLSFVPYVGNMSNKLSLSQMEFIRREKDRQIEAQRERALNLVLLASILVLVLVVLGLMLRRQLSQKKQIEKKNAQLVKLGLQKDQLIDMLKAAPASSPEYDSLKEIVDDKVPFPDIKLSKRELEVLDLCCKGITNKEIAARLKVSVRTIESHKLNICNKVGVKSTPELIAFAFKSGLIK